MSAGAFIDPSEVGSEHIGSPFRPHRTTQRRGGAFPDSLNLIRHCVVTRRVVAP